MRALLAASLTTALPMIVGQRWISGPTVVKWSLGAVFGIVLLAIGGQLGGLAGSPVLGAGLTLVVGWFLGPRLRCDVSQHTLSPVASRILLLLFCVGLALMTMSMFRPVAGWDAWFTWSIKSKGLAVTGSFDSPVFLSQAYSWSSQSYPTLLPSWQALAYIVSGDLSISWPLQFQQAWLWTAGAIALVSLCAGYPSGAFLLPLTWVVTPQVVWQSMQGYADVPLAIQLVLGTLLLWTKRWDSRGHVVAGALLAGAALTKAEGLPLVAVILSCLLLTKKPNANWLLAPSMVLAAWLPWFAFTQLHGIADGMVSVSAVMALLQGQLPSRLPEIVWIMATTIFLPARWGVLVPACLITAVVARRLVPRLGAATLLQLALFAAVYDVTWYYQGAALEHFMATNVERILITPLGVLALSVGLGSRETSSPASATPRV
jgi:hypothetical protein